MANNGSEGRHYSGPRGDDVMSSRGPTNEGRTKPDVVAPGASILSVRSSAITQAPLWGDLPTGHSLHGQYCWGGGTSTSTGLVAGIAALVRQYLIQVRNHFRPNNQPSGALLKAFLVNGAIPIPGQFDGEVPPGSNSVCGFGRVDLTGSIYPEGGVQFDDDPTHAVASQEMRVFKAVATNRHRAMKITLAWTDALSSQGNGSLENHLYLQVIAPDGSILDGDVTAYALATNNVQRLIIDTPADGTYQIRVRGIDVRLSPPWAGPGTPRQDFALVVSNTSQLEID
jgi:serine protease AprX